MSSAAIARPTTAPSHANATLRVGRRELIAMVVGVLLYGGLSWLSNFSNLSGALGADIRPAVAIPIFMGFIFGPIVGFVTGMFGNFLGDFLLGYLSGFPPPDATGMLVRDVVAAYYLNWQIGNGLAGLIPGIWAMFHRRYQTVKDFIAVAVIIVIASAVGMGIPAFTDLLIYTGTTFEVVFNDVFIPILRHNTLVSLLIVPLVLYNVSRLDLNSTNWVQSGLLRRLLVAVFISAVVPTLLLGFFLSQQQREDGSGLLVQLAVTVIVTLFFTIANALLLAQSLSRPLLRLTEAAAQMQDGKLSLERTRDLKATEGSDELAQLSRLFGSMAEEVIEREQRLQQQVESLRIEIDIAKQSKQVEEITENEFFRDLQAKVKTMRRRGIDPEPPPPAPAADADATQSAGTIAAITAEDGDAASTALNS